MPSPRVAWRSIRNSFLNSGTCAAIKSIWRVATPRQIPTATHESFCGLALGSVVFARRLPRCQSRDGLAVCSRSGDAAEECPCGMASARADCCRSLRRDRVRSRGGRACRSGAALALRQDRRRVRSLCLWYLPAPAPRPSALGRNANRFSRFVYLVLPDGLRSRRRLHVATDLAENVGAPRCGWCRRFRSPSPHAWFCRSVECATRVAYSYAWISARYWTDRVPGLSEVGSRSSAKKLGEFGPHLGRRAHRHRWIDAADSHLERCVKHLARERPPCWHHNICMQMQHETRTLSPQ